MYDCQNIALMNNYACNIKLIFNKKKSKNITCNKL